MTDLKGQTALVTGAASGIGGATAVALASRGARRPRRSRARDQLQEKLTPDYLGRSE